MTVIIDFGSTQLNVNYVSLLQQQRGSISYMVLGLCNVFPKTCLQGYDAVCAEVAMYAAVPFYDSEQGDSEVVHSPHWGCEVTWERDGTCEALSPYRVQLKTIYR